MQIVTLLNDTTRAYFLPAREGPGGEKFGERQVLPPRVTPQQPGRLDVPEWYVEELRKERGWAARLGGGFRVTGRAPSPAEEEMRDRLRAAGAKLRELEAERSAVKAAKDAADQRAVDAEKKLLAAEAKLAELALMKDDKAHAREMELIEAERAKAVRRAEDLERKLAAFETEVSKRAGEAAGEKSSKKEKGESKG